MLSLPLMVRSLRISALLLLLALWSSAHVLGQTEEVDAERIYSGAVKLFEGGWYDRADKELAQFLAGFPHSPHRSEAVLLQAQSRFQMKDYPGAIQLLGLQLPNAGTLRDQYLYWMGEAELQTGELAAAQKSYRELLSNFPASQLRLEAAFGEAFAAYKSGNTAHTVELLQSPNRDFQMAAKTSTNETALIHGNFLLAEALVTQREFKAAQQILTQLATRGLNSELEWQREYLLTRVAIAEERSPDALKQITNLVSLAQAKSNAVLQATSLTLKAEVFEHEHQPQAAAETYEQITKLPGVPPEQIRRALLKLAQVAPETMRLSNVVAQLDTFLKQNPQVPDADQLRMTLGEVYLNQFYKAQHAATNAAPNLSLSTNLLHAAQGQFDTVVTQFTNSVSIGKAYLDRAWCAWEEAQLIPDPARLRASQESFQAAVEHLSNSPEQITARFKVADCFFLLRDYTNAAAQYRALCTQFARQPDVREKLLDHALYQWLRSSIALNDLKTARSTLDEMLAEFPSSPWAAQASLFYAQALVQGGDFEHAQQALAQAEKTFPNSPLLPQMRLAEADAFARQQKWSEAITRYETWLKQYTNHPACPQAQFNRAWCYAQSGAATNAFRLFTNLVQQFPTSSYAALGQIWAGDYLLNQKKYYDAEIYYQIPSKTSNAVPTEIAHQATLMAAKAAFFRQGWNDARHYLTNLVNDTRISPDIGAEAFFMLGDIEITDPSTTSTNKLMRYGVAINFFGRITNFYGGTRIAPLAMGRIADCHLQLATLDPNRYDMATNQYWQVMRSPLADLTTRSQAEVGLGDVLEKMADQRTNRVELLQEALTHYLNVAYAKGSAPGEQVDPFWMSKAAVAAGTLAAEKLQKVDQAEKLYEDMTKALPSLAADWEARLKALRQQRPR